MHEAGEGAERSAAEAVVWYRKAMERGNAAGAKALAALHRDGRRVAKDIGEARRLFQRAVELGSESAAAELARRERAAGG
jgi:TPR repeat protein